MTSAGRRSPIPLIGGADIDLRDGRASHSSSEDPTSGATAGVDDRRPDGAVPLDHLAQIEEGLRCAQEMGDLPEVGRLVLQHWEDYASHGRVETMHRSIVRLSDDEIASDPALAIGAAWVFVVVGDGERAERHARAAERHRLDVPSPDGARSLRSALANLRSGIGGSGVAQMLRDGELVRDAESPTGSRSLLGGCRAIGIANLMLGNTDDAIAMLEEAVLLAGHGEQRLAAKVFCLGFLALAHLDTGDVGRAGVAVADAVTVVDQLDMQRTVQFAPVTTARAAIRVRHGDLVGAAEDLAVASEALGVTAAVPWLLGELSLRCGETAFDLGEIAAAQSLAEKAHEALARLPDAGVTPQRLERLDQELLHLGHDLVTLTPAERRVLRLLPTHQSLGDIGQTLYISRSTVKTHVSSIYSKLGVNSRAEAVAKLEHGAP